MYFDAIVLSPISAEPVVSVDVLFCDPFGLPFPKAVILNYHHSTQLIPFSLSRWPFSCSKEEIAVTRSLTSSPYPHLCTSPYLLFSCLRDVSLFSMTSSVLQMFIGYLLCPRHILSYLRYSHAQNRKIKIPCCHGAYLLVRKDRQQIK